MSDLYDLSDGWEWKPLNEAFIIKDGTHDSPKYIEEKGYPLFTSKNLKENGLDTSNFKLISEEDYNKINQRSKVDKGDLLFAMIGTIGNPTIIENEPNFAIKNVALFKPLNSENTIKYLRYYFLSNFVIDKMIKEANGATQKFVGLTYLRNFPFPSIPLSEQQRIVSKLDKLFEKIDKAIALHQKNMDEADVFMGSVLNDVFGELEEKYGLNILSDSVANPKKDIVDGPFGSNLKATEYIDFGIPIIRLQNIQRFQFIEKDIKFVSEVKAQQLQRHTFISGDIVITKLGDPLGKSCIVPDFLENGIIVADVIRVRVDETKSNSKYINYSINSPTSINQFSENSTGATRQRVKLTMVRDLKIPLPSLQIQQKVVSYLDEISQKIEKIKQIQKEKMESLKALKASILDQAFRGEL